MQSSIPKTLAFRYLYVSSVVKEDIVTVFGQQGSEFVLGTDYDAMITYKVLSSELSNFLPFYNGGILNGQQVLPNGLVGSSDVASQLSTSGPVKSIQYFNSGYKGAGNLISPASGKASDGQYNLGDIVLFDPATVGATFSANASCWTCIRATSTPADPLPLYGSVPPLQINQYALPGATGAFSGFYGQDQNQQNFITGVVPAYYTAPGSTMAVSPQTPNAQLVIRSSYWQESQIAQFYDARQIYYAGQIVVFGGSMYECITTQGDLAVPSLFLNPDPATETTIITPPGTLVAPNGAYGYDFNGQRYLQSVPPSGGLFSSLFWNPVSRSKVPTSVFALVNWDNLEIHNKLNSYDANIGGGNGAQTIPSFKDDVGINVTTLGQIYDQNESGFSLAVANAILARIPAAAIKAQQAGVKPTPDSSLAQMVRAGPTKTSPGNYSAAVQGVFEESIYRDMLSVNGTPGTIQSFVVAEGSKGYFQDGSTGRPQLIFTNTVSGNPVLATNPASVPLAIDSHAYGRCGIDSIFVDKTKASYAADVAVYVVGDVLTFLNDAVIGGTTETMFHISATAVVQGVSSTGKILSVAVTNPGDGYLGVPSVKITRISNLASNFTYLVPIMKLTSVGYAYNKANTADDSWGFSDGLTYAVQYGSGSGAVAYATLTPGTGSGGSYTNTVSFDFANNGGTAGSNYVVTNYAKDIIRIGNSGSSTYLPAEVQTVNPNGGITSVKLLKQGSGYLRDPIVNVSAPPRDPSAQGGITGDYTDAGLVTITQAGKYKPGYAGEGTPFVALSTIGSTYGRLNPYLGVQYVDVVAGGQGYSVGDQVVLRDDAGEQINVALMTPSLGSTGGTFSVDNLGGRTLPVLSILDGGSGYKVGSTLILDGPSGTTGQLVCKVTNTGGNVTSLGFSSANLVGVSFKSGDTVNLGRNAKSYAGIAGDALFADVTAVGPYGQLYSETTQKGGTFSQKYSNDGGGNTFLYLADTGFTGALYGNVVYANEVFKSIKQVNILPGVGFAYNSIPPVVISAPDAGTSYAGVLFPTPAATATAVANMALNGLIVYGSTYSSGFVTGDVFYIGQAGGWAGLTATATVLQTGPRGSVTALGVERAGSGFDPSQSILLNYNSLGGTYTASFELSPVFVIGSITVTNPGWGYSVPPTVVVNSGSATGIYEELQAVIGFNGGGAQFGLTGLSGADYSNAKLQLISRGSGYTRGELLAIQGPLVTGGTAASGLYTFADQTVGGNILAANVDGLTFGTAYNVGTYTSELDPGLTGNQPFGFGGASAGLTLTYSVLTTGDPTSISGVTMLESISAYSAGSAFTHKKIPDVRVASIDANGAVTSLRVVDPGYGFVSLPTATIPGSGSAVSLQVPYLGISRVENTFVLQGDNTFSTSDAIVSGPKINPAANVYTTISGDLYPITVDAFKNPNLLANLETVKPGSTTCYGQGVASMSLASGQGVLVQHSGKNLGDFNTLGISISAPTGKNGVQATAVINPAFYDPVTGIGAVTVTNTGAGYLSAPTITLSYSGAAPSDLPVFKAQMVVSGVEVTGRGLGYNPGLPPTVTFADSDVTPGTRALGTATLKSSLSSLSVEASGAHYLSVPNVRVVSQGSGALGYVRMGVSDLGVEDGGAGFLVGDVLTFGLFGVTGATYSYDAAILIAELGNTGPPSDRIFVGGVTLGTRTLCATVSEVSGPLNSIESVVINSNAYQGTTGIYGEAQRSLSANDFLRYGGVGYGATFYVDTGGMTWTTEVMPRVTGFYRPASHPLVQGYLTAGTTLTNSLVPWIGTNNTVLTGLTYAPGLTYLNPLTFISTGQGLTAMISGNFVEQPKISCRLAVQDFGLYGAAGQGSNFVCDAQVLVETPPPSRQARYEAVISGGQVTGYTQISEGDGYTSIPNVAINGGGGNGALATANLGVSKIHIIDGGSGSSVGDFVTVLNTGSGQSATGIVTVVDDGILGVGKNAMVTCRGVDAVTVSTLTIETATGIVTGGAIKNNSSIFVETEGYGYSVGSTFAAFPESHPSNTLDNSEAGLDFLVMNNFVNPVSGQPTGFTVSLDHYCLDLYLELGRIISVSMKGNAAYPDFVAPILNSNPNMRAILLVNTVDKQGTIYTLYDKAGALVNSGPFSYTNNGGQLQRSGFSPSYGQKQSRGEGAENLVNFLFLGWSDRTNGIDATYGGDQSAFYWWNCNQMNISGSKDFTRTPAIFEVTNINDQQQGIITVNILNLGTGGFFDATYRLSGSALSRRGRISNITMTNPGTSWSSLPDPTHITVVQNAGGAVSNTSAVLVPSLSVTGLSISSPGSNFVAAPTIQIDAPLFRSLKPQLYSRSAEIFDLSYTSTSPPTGGSLQLLAPGEGYLAGGVYKLVVDETVGGLHQTGNASNSVESFIVLGGLGFLHTAAPTPLTLKNVLLPDYNQTGNVGVNTAVTLVTSSSTGLYSGGFANAPLSGTLLENSYFIQEGSDYRVGEVYTIVPYGTTPPPNQVASVKILRVTSTLNYDRAPAPGINTGTGILDRGLLQNGEDVGGYGAGYVTKPVIRIVGGNQGIVPSASLALVGVDFGGIGTRGTNYNVNDQVWALFKEFGPRQVGVVSTVLSDSNGYGQIGTITLFTPRKSGLQTLPDISVVRLGGVTAGSVNATLKAVLGVEAVQITNATDGFVGAPFVEVDNASGSGYIIPLTTAVITSNTVQMIDTINVTQPDSSLVLYQTPPLVQIQQPPFVHTYSGWNGLRFDAGDSFDFIVQYTVAKAVAFQVDPDVTLTGPYQTATSISIGGVTIPLRAPGASNSQGRELSANKVVYRYLVKLLAV